ncbi:MULTISPECIES: FAD-binding oxidoreductase [unclassified Saccharopolyspora]|uniref:FAD-binding oxidoreductase n=1 Tax=unclassified Saccharopolyspora TaxID=2646250 RepID=UPI001CD271A4|nr:MULTISPECIES: FAD-linked oxidase C-terminal domain-containing protein [unclassified Saccharopolyspora]MCA1185653.1 FAD-binding protein [Saccharopolyspora sp. 6T]MCA1191490.1 FAD-binding protein [Saccharopolyspora sp. 6V]MCA1226837.1 FAD-binding protein [Saccharopolyspora sp. 6M]MCA1280709.1 FAD-binding protein [Saccharopolyspora sp. 7B]
MDTESTLAALRARVPEQRLVTDPDSVGRYAHDEAEWAPHGTPAAVVRPESTDDVVAVVQVCHELGVPVVPRGAGTGLSGGANALDGCVLISFERMNRILEINPREQLAVTQPGVVNDDFRAACREHGAWYPPDPASSPWSTIGGNVATNAGGVCCVKYGVTRDYVLGLEAVVGSGEVVRLGRRTAKGVTGYDLCGLFVGSEGTLGIITEITVKLLPGVRAPERTVVGYFDSLVAAGEAVAAVAASGVVPSALELLDRHCLRAVDEWKNMGLSDEAEVLLLGRSDTPGEAGEQEVATLVECFEKGGATFSAASTDQHEADALFAARRLAYPALERLGPLLTEDVCVPRALVPDMLAKVEAAAQRHDTLIANIAHAGDGNLHPLIITPAGDEAARTRAQRAFDDIVADAIALGGTVSGEHGIGLLKRAGLHDELGPTVVGMHHAVKNGLDPAGIFNPGKVFGTPEG